MLSRTSHPTREKMIATLSRKAKPKSLKKKKKSILSKKNNSREEENLNSLTKTTQLSLKPKPLRGERTQLPRRKKHNVPKKKRERNALSLSKTKNNKLFVSNKRVTEVVDVCGVPLLVAPLGNCRSVGSVPAGSCPSAPEFLLKDW